MVRGEQIGGINLDTKMRFNIKKAENSRDKGKTVNNNEFLVTLLDNWEGLDTEKQEGEKGGDN